MIVTSFDLVNKSTDKLYSMLYCICKLKVRNSVIGTFLIEPHSGTWQNQGEVQIVPEEQSGSTSDVNLAPAGRIRFERYHMVSADFLRVTNAEFDHQLPGQRFVQFDVELYVYATQYRNDGETFGASEGNFVTSFIFSRRIEENEWLNWIRSIGYRTTLISVPQNLANKIDALAKERGMLKEWELISMSLESFSKNTPTMAILRGDSATQRLKGVIAEMIDRANKRIHIAVQYIDTTLLPELKLAATNRKVDMKLLTVDPEPRIFNTRNPKATALREIASFGQIRTSRELHSRMVLTESDVIVGSMDLDVQGLTFHENIAMMTNDVTAVSSASQEFNEMFLKAKEFTPPA